MSTLTGWHTISEISDNLNLPYETLRKIVRNASMHGETWVKMERFPHHWLIDTDSAAFKLLVEESTTPPHAGEEQQEDTSFASPIVPLPCFTSSSGMGKSFTGKSFVSSFMQSSHGAPSGPLSPPQHYDYGVSITRIWPELCQWLRDSGVLIFSNMLEDINNARWQWQWGELTGEGYETLKDAILSALQAKIAQAEPPMLYAPVAPPVAPSAAEDLLQEDTQRSWFKRKQW